MSILKIETPDIAKFLAEDELEAIQPAISAAHNLLVGRTGPGSQYLGWLDLPKTVQSQVTRIKEAAAAIRSTSDALVVVGIGGSYLGARAAIEALAGSFHNLSQGKTKIFYAGHNLSGTYHAELLDS